MSSKKKNKKTTRKNNNHETANNVEQKAKSVIPVEKSLQGKANDPSDQHSATHRTESVSTGKNPTTHRTESVLNDPIDITLIEKRIQYLSLVRKIDYAPQKSISDNKNVTLSQASRHTPEPVSSITLYVRKKLIGYYSPQLAAWYGSFLWESEDGKQISITEVCEEGTTPVTINCGIQYVGPIKKFIRRQCPTDESKEWNCVCKANANVYFSDSVKK